MGLVVYVSAPVRVEAHYWEYFLNNRSLTSFYSSWRDTTHLLWRGHIFEAAEKSDSVFYPAQSTFGSSEAFYKSIGMTDFFDIDDQEAPTIQERDYFYYGNALCYMAEHFRTSEQRLFSFVITMAGHQPYSSPYMPDFKAHGSSPDLDPEVSEWLRRVAMANEDYNYLKDEVSKRLPGEPFLFVHYGDHQPIVTRPHVTFDDQESGSSAYNTYFAIEGINYTPPKLPEFDELDVAYLGLMIMEAAGIQLTDVYRERERLMHLCEGRYYDCAFRDEVLDFHRRLIDSGLVTVPR